MVEIMFQKLAGSVILDSANLISLSASNVENSLLVSLEILGRRFLSS